VLFRSKGAVLSQPRAERNGVSREAPPWVRGWRIVLKPKPCRGDAIWSNEFRPFRALIVCAFQPRVALPLVACPGLVDWCPVGAKPQKTTGRSLTVAVRLVTWIGRDCAFTPTTSLGLLDDHRDQDAQLAKSVVEQVSVFNGLTETERSTISNRSIKLFTVSGICNATHAGLPEKAISAFAECGMAATVKAICEEIRELSLWDEIPWVIGYSGGKDSSAVPRPTVATDYQRCDELRPYEP
jgi:hypothetical protein